MSAGNERSRRSVAPGPSPQVAGGRARRTARGRITLVQEMRFLLTTAAGQGLLLTLAHNANVHADDLHRFHTDGTEVTVEYQGEPGFVSAAAHRVRPSP